MLVRRRPRVRRPHPRRGGALYMVVVCSSLVITLAGLAGMRLMVTDRANLQLGHDIGQARLLSRSAVELGFVRVNTSPGWRNTWTNGSESTPLRLHPEIPGTVSWFLKDSDGSVQNKDVLLRLHGVGRVGEAVQVASVRLTELQDQNGPVTLRSQTVLTYDLEDVKKDRAVCQYLKVKTLPAEATAWWVTGVDLYLRAENTSSYGAVRVYKALPTMYPGGDLVGSADLTPANTSSSLAWNSYALSGAVRLDPAEAICIALPATDGTSSNQFKVARRKPVKDGVDADAAFMDGDPDWKAPKDDKMLLFRLHGMYETPSGVVGVLPGTWQSEEAP